MCKSKQKFQYRKGNKQEKQDTYNSQYVMIIMFLHKFPCSSVKSSIICRKNKEDTPSILHRYSIDSPSFRWRIDGLLMDYRWSMYGVKIEFLVELMLFTSEEEWSIDGRKEKLFAR